MTADMVARDPFDLVVEREDRVQRIKQALLAMSERERQVLLLDHAPPAEPLPRIARRLRISIEEAERHLASARRRLAGIPGV